MLCVALSQEKEATVLKHKKALKNMTSILKSYPNRILGTLSTNYRDIVFQHVAKIKVGKEAPSISVPAMTFNIVEPESMSTVFEWACFQISLWELQPWEVQREKNDEDVDDNNHGIEVYWGDDRDLEKNKESVAKEETVSLDHKIQGMEM
ncbi:hypothetical protein GH714_030166 [Hevea brasiliensis]|uniref:Uncharacterized protein n=1 Tax=Hevea brasiliensis TaxID=3981 RepID=A0A6A6LC65_HEVBR|nr:hypothetical protein GH714_030166 [Hevea brasiliensis]